MPILLEMFIKVQKQQQAGRAAQVNPRRPKEEVVAENRLGGGATPQDGFLANVPELFAMES